MVPEEVIWAVNLLNYLKNEAIPHSSRINFTVKSTVDFTIFYVKEYTQNSGTKFTLTIPGTKPIHP